MCARDDGHERAEFADVFHAASVCAPFFVENHFRDLAVDERVENRFGFLRVFLDDADLAEMLVQFGFESLHRGFTIGLGAKRFGEQDAAFGLKKRESLCVDRLEFRTRLSFDLFFADGFADLVHEIDDRSELFRAKLHRFKHIGLGDDVHASLDHDGFVRRAGDDEVKSALGGFLIRRHGDEFAVFATDADRGDRAVPRDTGHGERARRADEAGDVRVVFLVMRKDGGDHRHLVAHAVGEERADRAVDQTAGENRLVGRTTFALHKARAFDAARRVHALFEIDLQREKVESFADIAHGRRTQDDGVAKAHGAGATGLLGELADADRELFTGPVDRKFFWLLDHREQLAKSS